MSDEPEIPVASENPTPSEPAKPAPEETAEQVLAELVADALASVPEALRGLVPDVAPANQLRWINQARKAGLFEKPKPDVPVTDTAKPAVTPKRADFNSLPIHARIAAGYRS